MMRRRFRTILAAATGASVLMPAAAAFAEGAGAAAGAAGAAGAATPHAAWGVPFVILLLCIALLPLIHKTEHWWHKNQSKLLVGGVLGAITLGYYAFVGSYHGHEGLEAVTGVLWHAVGLDYIPFMALLFSLYTIAGGIELTGDLKAQPKTNTMFLATGAAIASFVGTTGAAMLLIRPLLRTNSQRRHVVHTVIFFIFSVCNCGGLLLPIGDPPLFLGYLKGVPFLWTFGLWAEFLIVNVTLLIVYYIWDTRMFAKEDPEDIAFDETNVEPLRLNGKMNLLLLLGVVFCVALLDPSKTFPGTEWNPPRFMREGLMFGLAGMSYFLPAFTPKGLRERAKFDFFAINEVGALFIGIFITMQVPLQILSDPATVTALGIDSPLKAFWATGLLSSCLDNAPTYVVFFQAAQGLEATTNMLILGVNPDGTPIQLDQLMLAGISCGAVFLGAMTYIGNGPNFLVKAVAEQAGIKMPSFFGYMKYSFGILAPIFVIVSLLFFL